MISSEIHLRSAIQVILEDLAKLNTRAGRGWGTASPIVVGSTRMMLGDLMGKEDSEDPDPSPVKVSRAFLIAQAIDDPATS